MYLLHFEPTDSGKPLQIQLSYHIGDAVPPYAILSHRWGAAADEVTFQDLNGGNSTLARQKKGYYKVEACCAQALKDGLTYAWIDTCCIDKSSSAELSEAINSMYRWYSSAQVCYAYLEDVPSDQDPRVTDSLFRKSTWFTRGWTLQELIAPAVVLFFAGNWAPIESKSVLGDVIEEITNVGREVLMDRDKLYSTCVAQKMSWASQRRTTRLEDEAYSLIGLFGVNMPTLYGEGPRAFIRLQEEILRLSNDHTIFAWDGDSEFSGMLATSPRQFAHSAGYRSMEYVDFADRFGIRDRTIYTGGNGPFDGTRVNLGGVQPNYAVTNFGLHIQLPLFQIHRIHDIYVAFLSCTHGEEDSTVIYLRHRSGRPKGHFYRTLFDNRTTHHIPKDGRLNNDIDLIWISGNEPQSQPKLRSVPKSISNPPTYHLCVKVEQDGLESSPIDVADCHPREAVTWKSAEALATLEAGEHVLLLFRRTNSEGLLYFVFGVISGRPWISYGPGEEVWEMEKFHRSFHPFGYRGSWDYKEVFLADWPGSKALCDSHSSGEFNFSLSRERELFNLVLRSKEEIESEP